MPSLFATHLPHSSTMTTPATNRQSRVFLVGLGLVIAAIGGLFCFWLGKAYMRVLEVDKWPAVPCLLVKSEVVEFKPVPNVAPRYRLEVDFFYKINGQTLHSDKVRSRVRTTTDRQRAAGWRDKYPAGSETVCFANPADPTFAILEKESKAVGYTIWFPALFVVGGLGIAIQAVRRR